MNSADIRQSKPDSRLGLSHVQIKLLSTSSFYLLTRQWILLFASLVLARPISHYGSHLNAYYSSPEWVYRGTHSLFSQRFGPGTNLSTLERNKSQSAASYCSYSMTQSLLLFHYHVYLLPFDHHAACNCSYSMNMERRRGRPTWTPATHQRHIAYLSLTYHILIISLF